MILTTVRQLFLSNVGFVVLLDSDVDDRSLPIFIGAAEAQAIAIHMNDIEVPRPLTHDLLMNTLETLGCNVTHIEVSDLREGTFYARILLTAGGEDHTIDSRPSDAIALALRCGAPIYVEEKVMKEAGRVFEEDGHEEGSSETSDGTPKLPDKQSRHLTPLKALQANLEKCVEDERYEDAAKLRDEINRLKESHKEN
jgi:bifunctional DNase/RNase